MAGAGAGAGAGRTASGGGRLGLDPRAGAPESLRAIAATAAESMCWARPLEWYRFPSWAWIAWTWYGVSPLGTADKEEGSEGMLPPLLLTSDGGPSVALLAAATAIWFCWSCWCC